MHSTDRSRGRWFAALRSEAGTTVIETAILLPVFLTFMLGIFEFGRALWLQSSLQSAAQAAARCAVVSASSTCNSNSATASYASTQVIGFSVPSSDFSVSSSGTCGSGGSKTVTAGYPFSFIVTALFPYNSGTNSNCSGSYNICLTARATRPC